MRQFCIRFMYYLFFFANPKVYPFDSNRLKELLCNSNTYSFVFPEKFLIFLYIRFHGAGLAKIQF